MNVTTRALTVAALACLALAAPASAAEVLRVERGRTVAVEDPLLPPPSVTDLSPPPRPRGAAWSARAAAGARGPSVPAVLRRAVASRRISKDDYEAYRALYREARATARRLRGARRTNLARVVRVLERIAGARQLTPSRMPALFLELRRNTEYWPRQPLPAAGTRVTFAGSPVVFQHYPGQGLRLQPLGNFGKANAIYNACREGRPTCDRPALRELLDWMLATRARRGGFSAWEYYFPFGGGSPPWVSAMAQGTALQALARGSQLLGDPAYVAAARAALRGFQTAPPVGVHKRVQGGAYYLHYSFARRLEVLNSFLQTLTGLFDYAQITGEARAAQLFWRGDNVARRELPLYDTGDWSLYARGGERADLGYHKLVTGFLEGLCDRTADPTYCVYAERFRGYLARPPRRIGREKVHAREPVPVTSPGPPRWSISVNVAGGRRSLVFRRGG